MTLIEIAAIAMDEDNMEHGGVSAGEQNLPPDLLAHDRKYHHGHYDGKSKCKYREDRKAALEGKQESEWNDIIDNLKPEDVDGEEIDNADRLEVAAAATVSKPETKDPDQEISRLKSMLGLMSSDLGKAIIGKFIKKNEEASIGPKLEKLREFAKSLGLDPSKISYGEVSSGGGRSGVSSTKASENYTSELKAKKERLAKDIDMIREKMQNASPRLAALLQQQLDGMEKSMKDIGNKLSGAGEQDDKDAEKERKRKEKEAKRKAQSEATTAFQDKIRNSSAPMSFSKAAVGGETVAMDSKDFKAAFDALPESQRIYALSDMHDTAWKKMGMSKCGTVMIAGDINDAFYSSPKYHEDVKTQIDSAQKWIDDTLEPFCNKHPKQQFVMCPGNHDNILALPEAKDLRWPSNVVMLNDEGIKLNGMSVYGTGICGRREGMPESYFEGRPYELSDEEYKKRADAIPEGLDVLMIHHPPKAEGYGGDTTMVNGKTESNGMAYLTEVIKRKKPKLVICGHLHDGDHRPYKIGDSVVINAARVSGWSRSSNGYTHHDIGMTNPTQGNVGFFVDGEDNHIA